MERDFVVVFWRSRWILDVLDIDAERITVYVRMVILGRVLILAFDPVRRAIPSSTCWSYMISCNCEKESECRRIDARRGHLQSRWCVG